MKNNMIKSGNRIVEVILSIAIIVILVIAFSFFMQFLSEYKELSDLPYDRDNLYYSMDNLARFEQEAGDDKIYDPDNSSLRDYYALYDYMESSIHIAAGKAIGDDAQVTHWSEVKEASKDNLGDLSSYCATIDALFQ